MLRSFDYARHAALEQCAKAGSDPDRLVEVARQWERGMRAGFLQTYGEVVVAGGLYAGPAQFEAATS